MCRLFLIWIGVRVMPTAATSSQLGTTLIAAGEAGRTHQFGGPEVITLEDMVPGVPARERCSSV